MNMKCDTGMSRLWIFNFKISKILKLFDYFREPPYFISKNYPTIFFQIS